MGEHHLCKVGVTGSNPVRSIFQYSCFIAYTDVTYRLDINALSDIISTIFKPGAGLKGIR
jgi:hypothetical protein